MSFFCAWAGSHPDRSQRTGIGRIRYSFDIDSTSAWLSSTTTHRSRVSASGGEGGLWVNYRWSHFGVMVCLDFQEKADQKDRAQFAEIMGDWPKDEQLLFVPWGICSKHQRDVERMGRYEKFRIATSLIPQRILYLLLVSTDTTVPRFSLSFSRQIFVCSIALLLRSLNKLLKQNICVFNLMYLCPFVKVQELKLLGRIEGSFFRCQWQLATRLWSFWTLCLDFEALSPEFYWSRNLGILRWWCDGMSCVRVLQTQHLGVRRYFSFGSFSDSFPQFTPKLKWRFTLLVHIITSFYRSWILQLDRIC
jgi:hypothetical protein